MQQLIEYSSHHPLLAGAAVLGLLVVAAYELRSGTLSLGALGTMQAVRLMNEGALVIDLRAPEAFSGGHIGEARNIPAGSLAAQADTLKKWRDRNVIIYCDTGRDAAGAVRTLTKLGFTKVFSLDGGLGAWSRDNLPLVRSAGGGGQG